MEGLVDFDKTIIPSINYRFYITTKLAINTVNKSDCALIVEWFNPQ
jgi:hypothetical protein